MYNCFDINGRLYLNIGGGSWEYRNGEWVPDFVDIFAMDDYWIPVDQLGDKVFKKGVDEGFCLLRAKELALIKHAGQKDKGGNDYFTAHLSVVAERAKKDSFVKATVAYLHDILEDTDTTEEYLRKLFPDNIVDAVVALTHREGEPYFDYIARIKENELAKGVKIYDLANNMDLERIPNPTEKDEKRVLKYAKAMAFLMKP